MSEGLSRSILRILPVERASIKTLLATCAATKSEEMENCSCTLSTLTIGREASSSSAILYGAGSCRVELQAMLCCKDMTPVRAHRHGTRYIGSWS